MPERTYRGGGASSIGSKDQSIVGVLKGKLTSPDHNWFMNALDTMAFVPQGLAGMAKEEERRHKGYEARPYWTAFKTGVAKRQSFMDLEGMPKVAGLTLDIVADPQMLTGFSAVRKVISKGILGTAKVTGLTKIAKSTYKLTEANSSIRKSKEALAGLFNVDHAHKKYTPGIRRIKEVWLDKLHANVSLAGKSIKKTIEKKLPSFDARVRVANVMDIEPASVVANDNVAWLGWWKRYDALSDTEKEVYGLARDHLDELEKIKLEFTGLTVEQARAFEAKAGVRHVPHRIRTSEDVLADAKEMRRLAEVGDEEALEMLSHFKRGKEELDDIISRLDVDDAWGARRGSMSKVGKHGASPHTRERKLEGSMEDIKEKGLADFDMDVASILETESVIVGRQRARTEYLEGMMKHLQRNGLAIPDEVATQGDDVIHGYLTSVETHGKKAMSADEADKMIRGGFSKLRGFTDLAGFHIPKTAAKEFDNLAKMFTEGAYHDVGKLINNAVAWQKAWMLMPFIEYHSRNFISNKWNMHLGGFTVRDSKHLIAGNELTWKWMRHGIPLDNKGGKVLYGMTEKELFEQLVKHRIYDTGEAISEIGMAMKKQTPRNLLMGFVDPRQNKNYITRGGFFAARQIENSDRVAGALRILGKGGTMEDAARWTHKYLFDYKHGLSVFEDQILRKGGLMPFYAWLRFNLPLQLEMMVKQPQKFGAAGKVIRGVEKGLIPGLDGGPDPGPMATAEWLQRATSIRIGYNEKTGDYEHFVFDSWWPAADVRRVADLPKEILGQINPVWKLPFEIPMNYDTWRMSKIERFPGERQKFLGRDMNKKLIHFMRLSRLATSFDKAHKTYGKEGGGRMFRNIVLGKTYTDNAPMSRARNIKAFRKEIRYFEWRRKVAAKKGDKSNVEHLTKLIGEWNKEAYELGFKPKK